MRKANLLFALLAFLFGLQLWAQTEEEKEEIFLIDYFGYNIPVMCRIPTNPKKAESFEELVSIDTMQIEDCYKALAKISETYQFTDHNYGQVLLFWRFAEALPNGEVYRNGWVSFAEVALNKDQKDEKGNPKIYLGRNDKIALIYSLLSRAGYGVKVLKANENYYLTLKLGAEIYGWYLSEIPNYYRWEPGYNFHNIPAQRRPPGIPVLSNNGAPVTFHHLGAIPWNQTAKADFITFRSPSGCPSSWNFSVNRLPAYEEFLQFWPKDAEDHRIVQACFARQIFTPFAFEEKFNPEKNPELKEMPNDQLGNCLFKWLRLNTPYGKGEKNVRDPVKTLLVDQTGDCDELSLALVGVLSSAGFPPQNLILVHWLTHMGIGVLPIGDLKNDSFLLDPHNYCKVEHEGKIYHIMDPSYRCIGKTASGEERVLSEEECDLRWGLCSDDLPKQVVIELLEYK